MNWSLLSSYTWYELFSPIWIFILIALSYLYMHYFVCSNVYQVTRSQIKYFFSALFLIFLTQGSPFSIIAQNYLFSAHVVQLVVILFIVTPLLLLSLPFRFLRSFFWNYKMRITMRLLSHPWLTAILFNGLLTAYFIPAIFNTLKENAFLLITAQLILVINAFFMWWVIINPLPKVSNLSHLTRVMYIFFTSILLMPIGVFLLIILHVHYPFYHDVEGKFMPVLTIIYDQQLGGGLLKITQVTSYAYALLRIVMHWGRLEELEEGQVDDENIRVVQGVVINIKDHKK